MLKFSICIYGTFPSSLSRVTTQGGTGDGIHTTGGWRLLVVDNTATTQVFPDLFGGWDVSAKKGRSRKIKSSSIPRDPGMNS